MKAGQLLKTFRKSKVNYCATRYHQNICTELDTASVNQKLGPLGHKAITEIRLSLMMLGSIRASNMDPDYVPSTSDILSEEMKVVWSRFRLWLEMTKDKTKEREATIGFAKGKRLREIERLVKARNGTGRELIENGANIYSEIIRHEGLTAGQKMR